VSFWEFVGGGYGVEVMSSIICVVMGIVFVVGVLVLFLVNVIVSKFVF